MQPTIIAANAQLSGRLLNASTSLLQNTHFSTLNRFGFCVIDQNDWYGLSEWLACLQLVADEGTDLRRLGFRTAINFLRTHNTDCSPDVAAAMDEMYRQNHRGHGSGPVITLVRQTDASLRVLARLPYPATFVEGFFEGLLRGFLPAGAHINVSCNTQHPSILGMLQLYRIDVTWSDRLKVSDTAPV